MPVISGQSDQLEQQQSEASTSASQDQGQARGLAKGRPGCEREPEVMKRQERRREEPVFTKRKRSFCSDGQAMPQPPKKILRAVQPTLQTTPSQSPSSTPSASPARSISSVQELPEPAERREKLKAQIFENLKKTQVKLIQDSSGSKQRHRAQ